MKNGKIAQREDSVSQFIPYLRHIDGETIKTTQGYLLKVIKLDGIPFETADQTELNQKKNVRATMLKSLSNSRFALYQHTIRRKIKDTQDSYFENEFCKNLDSAYQARMDKKRMFINEQYLTIIRRPATSKIGLFSEISHLIFSKMDKQLQKQKEAENQKALNEAVSNILSTLAPYKPKVLSLNETDNGLFSENLSFLSYLTNFEKSSVRCPEMAISQYLPTKRISFGKETFELRGTRQDDVQLGAIISIKEYANATGPGMLDGLLKLPHEFVLTQSFGFVDRQTSMNRMVEARNKTISAEEGANSLVDNITEAIDDLASGQTSFGEHHLSLTVLGQNGDQLERALADCSTQLMNLGIVAAREDINLEAAYWAALPANFNYIARKSLISSHNFASFASYHNFPAGQKQDNHWGQAITRLETTSGTPYWFNFHERDVGNFTVIGPTGTGKTVLLTFLIAQAQRLKPKSIYFDKDRGAEIFIRAIGGDYTNVIPGKPTGLNPFQLEDTPENQNFLNEWLTLLITCDGGPALAPEEQAIITDAIKANYNDLDQHQRRLSSISELLQGYSGNQPNSLSMRLSKWHGSGDKAWLFDNAQDTLSMDNLTIGFDLTSILDDPISRTAWLMYIFHRVNGLLNGQKTIIMLDEGWKMLDDPVFSARIKDWMKTIRKLNGILGFATQSAKDATRSAVGDAIIEQSPTQIFLPNARAKEPDYCGGFGLSKHELKIIRNLTPESRCFLLKHGTDSIIAKLDLDGLEDYIKILSGRAETVTELEKLMGEHGNNVEAWLPHFIERQQAA